MLVSKEEHVEDVTNRLPPPSIKGIVMPIPEVLAESLGRQVISVDKILSCLG